VELTYHNMPSNLLRFKDNEDITTTNTYVAFADVEFLVSYLDYS
jgi:hypothetical protein